MSLAERMRAAADTLEELSVLYEAAIPTHYPWTPHRLRIEAEHVDSEGR